jgi:pimeloyl-ACP methyl ester carboxylesterase
VAEQEPVVLLHARPFVRWYEPLIEELGDRRTFCWRRDAPPPGLTIAADAAACIEHLGELGVSSPHVVGHSYGALVALDVARQTDVRSLALLEPAGAGFVSPDQAAENFAPLAELVRSSGPEAGMRAFLTAVCGDGAADALDQLVPGATAEAMAAAAGFFDAEMPAVVAHQVTVGDVEAIDIPVLNVIGTATAPRFVESSATVQAWLPHALRREIDGANHFLMAQRPRDVADELAAFWATAR